jgi:hypothetical protein
MSCRRKLIGRVVVTVLALGATLSLAPAGAEPLSRLPDGEAATSGEWSAYLIDPVTRYDHGVLGDAIEAGGFAVERKGLPQVLRLDAGAVFEDRRVRLADLDGDGVPEAIVIKSYLDRGSAVAVYRLGPDGITPFAESAAVGQPHRWLNIVGVADFTGSGERMIAAVVTPHLAGSLRIYRQVGQTLEAVARIDGFTNHILGQRDLDLARIDDIDGDGIPEIVLPTRDRKSLAAISFKGGAASIAAEVPAPARIVALIGSSAGAAVVKTEQGKQVNVALAGGMAKRGVGR